MFNIELIFDKDFRECDFFSSVYLFCLHISAISLQKTFEIYSLLFPKSYLVSIKELLCFKSKDDISTGLSIFMFFYFFKKMQLDLNLVILDIKLLLFLLLVFS